MTNHVVRLYAVALSLFGLFLTTVVIAAHPWKSAGQTQSQASPVLVAYEQRLRRDAVLVHQIVVRRRAAQIAAAKAAAATRAAALAQASSGSVSAPTSSSAPASSSPPAATPAPIVRVVTLPPLTPPVTQTHSS